MSTTTKTDTVPNRMQCMEVWGGNLETDRAFDMPGLTVWLSSRAYGSGEGGGDVYYISACASGRITRFLLADISGHGEAVSQTALRLRDLMRKNVNVVKQRRLVRSINEQFSEVSSEGLFATALVCTFFSPSHSFQWSNAGHPPPLFYSSARDAWSVLDSQSLGKGLQDIPLGIDTQAPFSISKIKLRPDDLVLCYSDAYTECLDHDGRVLGVAGLLEITRSLRSQPNALISDLQDRLQSLHAGNLKNDDATITVLQSVVGRTTLKDNLLAAVRMFHKARDATQFRTVRRTELADGASLPG
ncbi:MAG: serine/threonine-protein phosphatase [Pirellulales bacterium]|nr:serine/threonine-protein phosphatase [Pirellulales bacterium]